MNRNKVTIKSDSKNPNATHIFLNDVELKHLKSFSISQQAGDLMKLELVFSDIEAEIEAINVMASGRLATDLLKAAERLKQILHNEINKDKQ